MTGNSIFRRKKPLKPNTLRRIAAGAVKYCWPKPYIDAVQALLDGTAPRLVFSRAEAIELGLIQADPVLIHMRGTSDQHLQASARSADDPLPTLTAGGTHVGLVLATSSGGAARDLEQPLPTITTGGAGSERPGCARPQLVEPLVISRNNGVRGSTSRPVSDPIPTATGRGAGYLAEPLIVPTSNSSSAGVPRSVADPIRTVTTAKGGDQAMAVPLVAQYYGATATAQSVAEPVPSVTTKARFGLAEPVLMRAGHGDSDGRDPASRVLDADAPRLVIDESRSESKPDVQGLLQCVVLATVGIVNLGIVPRLDYVDERLPTDRLPRLNVDGLAVVAGAQRIALDFRRHIALLAGTSILAGTLLAVNVCRVVAPSTGAGYESPGNKHRHGHSQLLLGPGDCSTNQLRLFGAREASWRIITKFLMDKGV